MSRIHHSDSEPGWINRKFAELNRRVTENSAARRLEAATIGRGGLHVRGGDIFLEDASGAAIWQASVDPITMATATDLGGAVDFTGAATRYGETEALTMAVPAGFSRAQLGVFASGHDQFDVAGSITITPVTTLVHASLATTVLLGPTVTRGPKDVNTVTAFRSHDVSLEADGDPVTTILFGIDVDETANLNTNLGIWNLSVSAMFRRGA